MEHELLIADGSRFTQFTDEEKAIAASATHAAKGVAGAPSSDAGETIAQQNAAMAAVPQTAQVSTAVATPMLKSYQYFEYSVAQRSAAQTLYLATNKAFYNVLVNTTKGNALASVLTCKGDGFKAFQGLLEQNVEVSITFYMDRLAKMQTFRFSSKVHPRGDAATLVELCESLRESKRMTFDELMFVIYFMAALPRDAYKLILKDFCDKLGEKGADSMSVTEMVSKTTLFYETDVIKDNRGFRRICALLTLGPVPIDPRVLPISALVNNTPLQKSAVNAAKDDCIFCGNNGQTADACRGKLHCNICGKRTILKLLPTCTAIPCSTCNKYYYKSANHKYHKCDGPTAEIKGAAEQHLPADQTWRRRDAYRARHNIRRLESRDPGDDRERNNHFFHCNGLHIDMSDDQSLPQTNTDEGEDVTTTTVVTTYFRGYHSTS